MTSTFTPGLRIWSCSSLGLFCFDFFCFVFAVVVVFKYFLIHRDSRFDPKSTLGIFRWCRITPATTVVVATWDFTRKLLAECHNVFWKNKKKKEKENLNWLFGESQWIKWPNCRGTSSFAVSAIFWAWQAALKEKQQRHNEEVVFHWYDDAGRRGKLCF